MISVLAKMIFIAMSSYLFFTPISQADSFICLKYFERHSNSRTAVQIEKDIKFFIDSKRKYISTIETLLEYENMNLKSKLRKRWSRIERASKALFLKVKEQKGLTPALTVEMAALSKEYNLLLKKQKRIDAILEDINPEMQRYIHSVQFERDMDFLNAELQTLSNMAGSYSSTLRLNPLVQILKSLRSSHILVHEIKILSDDLAHQQTYTTHEFNTALDEVSRYTDDFKTAETDARRARGLEISAQTLSSGNYAKKPQYELVAVETLKSYELIYVGKRMSNNYLFSSVARLSPDIQLEGVRRGQFYRAKVGILKKERIFAVVGFFRNKDVLLQDMSPDVTTKKFKRVSLQVVRLSKKLEVSSVTRPLIFGDTYYLRGQSYTANLEVYSAIMKFLTDKGLAAPASAHLGNVAIATLSGMGGSLAVDNLILGLGGVAVGLVGYVFLNVGQVLFYNNILKANPQYRLNTQVSFSEVAGNENSYFQHNDMSTFSRNENALLDVRQIFPEERAKLNIDLESIVATQRNSFTISKPQGYFNELTSPAQEKYAPNVGVDSMENIITIPFKEIPPVFSTQGKEEGGDPEKNNHGTIDLGEKSF